MPSKKRGFTIIEVSLVLAIAGLIFLMVFIALPALQRSTRDTQRREDMITLANAIKKYQSNNRGTLPTGTEPVSYDNSTTNKTTWGWFYKNYINENFRDPSSGENYRLEIVDCANRNSCEGQLTEATFPNDYTIVIQKSASCSGETAVPSANPRKLAILYKLEGGGVYCGDV